MSWTAHSRLTDFTVAVVGTGSALLTNAADLFNGRPADATELRWLSAGSPAITDVVHFQFTRAIAFVPGLLGLVGLQLLGLPSSAGLKFSILGKRAGDAAFTYALGGNTTLQRSVARSDGSFACLTIPAAGLDPIVAWQLTIWNDQDGVPTLTPSQILRLGDIWASPAFDTDVDAGWRLQFPKAKVPTSPNGQPWPTPYPPGRVLPLTRDLLSFEDAFIDGAKPCYQSLCTLIGNGQVSIQVPNYLDSSGEFSAAHLHATAIFGTTDFNEIAQSTRVRTLYKASWVQTEVPALLA